MYTFIRSALVLLLLTSATAFYPEVHAKPIGNLAQPDQLKDVGPITLWQTQPGTLLASWVVFPPGNQSLVILIDVATQQEVQRLITPNTGTMFTNLPGGRFYLVSVAHGQNVRSEMIFVF